MSAFVAPAPLKRLELSTRSTLAVTDWNSGVTTIEQVERDKKLTFLASYS